MTITTKGVPTVYVVPRIGFADVRTHIRRTCDVVASTADADSVNRRKSNVDRSAASVARALSEGVRETCRTCGVTASEPPPESTIGRASVRYLLVLSAAATVSARTRLRATCRTIESDAPAESDVTPLTARLALSEAGALSEAERELIQVRVAESAARAVSDAVRLTVRGGRAALSDADAASDADRANACVDLVAASTVTAVSVTDRDRLNGDRAALSDAVTVSLAARVNADARAALSDAAATSDATRAKA
jgi:hypothetical protein